MTLLEKEGSGEPEVHLQGAPQMRLQEVDLGFQGDSPGVFKQVLDFTRSLLLRRVCPGRLFSDQRNKVKAELSHTGRT